MATNNIKQIKLPNNITYNIELCDDSKKLVLASAALTGTPTAPTATAGTNTTQIATTAFVNTEINNKIAAADAMIYKGTIGTNGTVTSLPTTHKTGYTYKVITAGNYAGIKCEIGDMIICLVDGTTANNAHWTVVQNNIDGAVIGPASSVDNRIAIFNGTTGKLIEDSGFTIATSVPANAKFTDTTYTFATGSDNGTFNVTPLGGTAQKVTIKGLGSAAYTASTAYATAAQGTKADNALPKTGGNISGHIYLTGANASSSTGSTSQIVFGTSSNNHVVISSNNNALVINPDITSTTNQIVLYLDSPSQFPCGISSGANIYENGVALANKYAPAYIYQTTDPGAGSSLAAGKLLFVYS